MCFYWCPHSHSWQPCPLLVPRSHNRRTACEWPWASSLTLQEQPRPLLTTMKLPIPFSLLDQSHLLSAVPQRWEVNVLSCLLQWTPGQIYKLLEDFRLHLIYETLFLSSDRHCRWPPYRAIKIITIQIYCQGGNFHFQNNAQLSILNWSQCVNTTVNLPHTKRYPIVRCLRIRKAEISELGYNINPTKIPSDTIFPRWTPGPRATVLDHRYRGGEDSFSAMILFPCPASEMSNHKIALFLTCFREEIIFLECRLDKWRQRNPSTKAEIQTICWK